MKTIKILGSFSLAFALFLGSCTRKDITTTDDTLSATDTQNQAKMDQASNDVQDVVEAALAAQFPSITGRDNFTILPACAMMTTVATNTSWTRTIDFGTTGCIMPSGNALKGKLIATGAIPYSPTNYTVTYSFDNFYHNEIKVGGTRTVTRTFAASTLSSTPHPIYNIDLNNMTLTFPNLGTYTRAGNRIREFVSGFGSPTPLDNIYLITGQWETTRPNGTSHSTTVSTPIKIDMSCQYKLTAGVLRLTKNAHYADINYGTGDCDNIYTVSIDGSAPVTRYFN
ncbi:MAG: hypothetical protein CFE24_08535 [Flavobacterium sp. BFFFF2]|nr:MAG: hypothetical protein CFE24_08535 [Flavobacterium sp. BFFFF2]